MNDPKNAPEIREETPKLSGYTLAEADKLCSEDADGSITIHCGSGEYDKGY